MRQMTASSPGAGMTYRMNEDADCVRLRSASLALHGTSVARGNTSRPSKAEGPRRQWHEDCTGFSWSTRTDLSELHRSV